MTTPTITNRWLRRLCPRADPEIRLVCLPHAGGTAALFASWAARMPAHVELAAVQYPGRHDRFGEPCVADVETLADGVAAALGPLGDRPLALFGHSMGAAVAYEVAIRLRDAGGPRLGTLFLSGQRPLHHLDAPAEDLDDAAVEAEIRRHGGTAPALLDDPELREVVLPALLADYRAGLGYRRRDAVRLDAELVVYVGRDDPGIEPGDMGGWSEFTSAGTSSRRFEGGHFYLLEREAELVGDIVRRLSD